MSVGALPHVSDLYWFSVNADLAYYITRRYFKRKYVVWVSEEFNPGNPPSSTPRKKHALLAMAAAGPDTGDQNIQSIKRTLEEVANKKQLNGEISAGELQEILDILQVAASNDYRPLIYVIRRDLINQARLIPVPIKSRPHFKSIEYRIEDLDESEFAVIETMSI